MKNLGRFRTLAILTLVVSYLLIIVGGIVRVEGAGMGCGDNWPVCNGKVIPTFTYLTALEYLHRVIASVVLLLSAILVVAGWKLRDVASWLFVLPVVAFALVIAQALLGAVTVFVELDSAVVTAHLGMAQTYLAIVIIITLLAFRQTLGQHDMHYRLGNAGRTVLFAAGTVIALMLSGAYVATSPAAWACPQWPGCHGNYFPTGTTPVDIHLLHRWLAILAVGAVFYATARVLQTASLPPAVAGLTVFAAVLMVVQVIVGAMNIWFELSPWVSVTHLGFATLVWGSLIAAAMLGSIATTAQAPDTITRGTDWRADTQHAQPT